tara:strand:+ start:24571 stop:24750 length:180 start_codon:yes stop_codon:yes gene_type:complete
MTKIAYYTTSKQFCGNFLCTEHNVAFLIRCAECTDKFGGDPDKTFVDGREFTLLAKKWY